MKLTTLFLGLIFSFNFFSTNAQSGPKAQLCEIYLGKKKFDSQAPKGIITFEFKEGTLKRWNSEGKKTYRQLLINASDFQNSKSAGLIAIQYKGSLTEEPIVIPRIDKIPKTYNKAEKIATETKPEPTTTVTTTATPKNEESGPIKIEPIGMIPDSIAQDSIKQKVLVSFNFWSTEVSLASKKAWETIAHVFLQILLVLIVLMFFFRFIAQCVSGEKPIKILALGLVSVNKFALKIFVWSSTIVLILSILVIGFFVMDAFLWICKLGLPVWLTAIALGITGWLGKSFVGWAVPDLKAADAEILLLGAGGQGPMPGH